MKLKNIIGKKVVAIKGFRTDMRRKKNFTAEYILFDDGETYIELEDQDGYTYHDCDSDAKIIRIRQNKKAWEDMMSNENNYPAADTDPSW